MSRLNALWWSWLAVGALALAGCDNGKAGEADSDEEDEAAAIPVQVLSGTRGNIYAVYSGTAALEAEAEADVVAKVAGEVLEILVEEGDQVTPGQILARLDGERLRLELRQSRANLRKLEQDYKRNQELAEKGLVSAGAFDNIKYEMDALRAAYNLASLELSYTEIRAPLEGVIAERFIKVGNTLAANDPTFHITDLDPLLAYLHIPEGEFSKLRADQPASLEVDALPDRRFEGKVARISPTVDPATGTFKATIEMNDPSGVLKPGMFGRFNIVYDMHAAALLVPRLAIVDDDARRAVFIVEDGIAHRRVIQTGFTDAGNIEITSGLDGTEKIVVIGQGGLKEGARVDVVQGATNGSHRRSAAD